MRQHGDPVLVALRDAADRFPIPLGAFGELIDGCEADVRGTSYATFDELEHYCRCVAGSIGRLSLGVFGSRDPGRGGAARRRARRRAAADQHPARHPRGPRQRPGVPARRGPRAVRLHADPAGPDGQGALTGDLGWPADPVRGERAADWYATGTAAAAAAGPAQRRLHGRDGRDLPAAARAHRARIRRQRCERGCRCPARREGDGRGARAGRDRAAAGRHARPGSGRPGRRRGSDGRRDGLATAPQRAS